MLWRCGPQLDINTHTHTHTQGHPPHSPSRVQQMEPSHQQHTHAWKWDSEQVLSAVSPQSVKLCEEETAHEWRAAFIDGARFSSSSSSLILKCVFNGSDSCASWLPEPTFFFYVNSKEPAPSFTQWLLIQPRNNRNDTDRKSGWAFIRLVLFLKCCWAPDLLQCHMTFRTRRVWTSPSKGRRCLLAHMHCGLAS